jgi:surface protein
MAVGSFKLPISAPSGDWTRPSDWLAMPTGITSANETFVGLHAIFPEGQNYCAFRFITSTGQYQVDWGDGTIDLVDSNVNAEHDYNYSTYDTGNTTLSSRGYKQAIITVTPVSGNLLTCNFQQQFVTIPAQTVVYSSGFLDCILSMPNVLPIGIQITFGGTTIRHNYIERFDVKTVGGANRLDNLFSNCHSLEVVPLFDTSNVTVILGMFSNCFSLKSIPFFNTQNVTNALSTFINCNSVQSVPLFDTQNFTNMQSMFQGCNSLQSVPLFNTANVNTMANMFNVY